MCFTLLVALVVCANPNNKIFQNQTYTLIEADDVYYVCQYTHAPRTVVYVVQNKNGTGYAKVVVEERGLDAKQQVQIAQDLQKFFY